MKINADFDARALVRFAETDWGPSPMPGVERKMLDRIGGEVARATSLVRYAPGSAFSPHIHDGGEEYLVLDGVFADEDGAFPTGAYVRNPPTSCHTPSAPQGATIFVKLHQFDPADRTRVHIDTAAADGDLPLFEDARERVRIARWAPGAEVALEAAGGLEILMLEGGLTEGGDTLSRWDWLRLPPGSVTTAVAGPQGARLWLKSGHLAHVTAPTPA